MEIYEVQERTSRLDILLKIWEDSVRATHKFLSEEEVNKIKEYVPLALKNVEHLLIAKSDAGIPVGFMGVENGRLEMLFLASSERGKGFGRQLLQYGIENYAVRELTVNEQNPQAVGFYQHMGFQTYKRTECDEEGNPYPLLYMRLGENRLSEDKKMIAAAVRKMVDFYKGNIHDIDHFLKVWAFARNIGEAEGLDQDTQEILELAAVIHDISCPLCREKYGNTNGKHQEEESGPLVEKFFSDLPVEKTKVERIKWLAEHHHTYTNVEGMDYQILLEADFLVNAGESGYSRKMIESTCEKVFRTATGTHLLKSMYLENR